MWSHQRWYSYLGQGSTATWWTSTICFGSDKDIQLETQSGKVWILERQIHILSKAGVRPDPEKIRAVQEIKPLENVKELMTFLGFVQYLGNIGNQCTIETVTQQRHSMALGRGTNEIFWET